MKCARIILFLAAAAARADGNADFETALKEPNPEVQISLYTRAIRSGDINSTTQGAAFYNRALAYNSLKDFERAVADFETSIRLLPKDPDPVRQSMTTWVTLEDFAKARPYAVTLLKDYPDAVKDAPFDILWTARADQIAGKWKEADELLVPFGKLLPDHKQGMLHRARDSAKLGRENEALDLIRRLDNQYTFVAAQFQREFEGLWDKPDFIKTVELESLWARERVTQRADMEKDPNLLDPVTSLMRGLRASGRMTEAIDLGEATIRNISRYTDRKTQEVWLYDELARSHKRLGNIDAVASDYKRGVEAVGLENTAVVNILINGGDFFARDADRYDDALDFAEKGLKVGASAYGLQNIRQIQYIAYLGRGGKSDISKLAQDLEINASSSLETVIEMYFLQDKIPEAAARVIKALGSTKQADTMLFSLQVYAKATPSPGKLGKKIDAGWNALRRDPGVLAAVAKVGRIATIPAAGSY